MREVSGPTSRTIPHAGQGEEAAPAERLDVVDERFVNQPFLDGLELPVDVLLIGDEDVAGGGGHLCSRQGRDRSYRSGARSAGWRLRSCGGWPAGCARPGRSRGLAGRRHSPERRTRRCRPAARRCPAAAAEHAFLLVDRDPVPELDQHADQPDHLIRAVARPGRLGRVIYPDQAAGHAAGGISRAVLEPVAGSARSPTRRGGSLKPSTTSSSAVLHPTAGVPGDVADRMMDGVGGGPRRVAGADHRAAMRGRASRSGNARIGVSLSGLQRGQAVPVIEQAGPHGHGDSNTYSAPEEQATAANRRHRVRGVQPVR